MALTDPISTESPYTQEKASHSGSEVKGYEQDGATTSLQEKPEERQLHRALKSRQISMIAIGVWISIMMTLQDSYTSQIDLGVLDVGLRAPIQYRLSSTLLSVLDVGLCTAPYITMTDKPE